MPNLPDVGLNQSNYERVLAAMEGDTNAEKVATYRKLVKRTLRLYVLQREASIQIGQIPDFDTEATE